MTLAGWLQFFLMFTIVLACVRPLGSYMARVFEGEETWMSPVLGPLERLFYRRTGIDAAQEMSWQKYLFAMLAFTAIGIVYLYVLLRIQAWLPLNPQHFPGFSPDAAFNTAISFATNTNWQFYSGESSLSYFSQMVGLAWHNFVSAGVGIALAIALCRGLARSNATTIGNFWVDLTRATLYVLLPFSLVGALVLVSQGVPQNFAAYHEVKTLEGATQTITGGPMASQEFIKEFGTNGGGFVNANSASPNENPTPLTDFIEMIAILVIPAALTYTFGRYVRDQRQGWALLAAMSALLILGFGCTYAAEAAGNPLVHALGIAGGNMEGKETRFGIASSALFATITTATSAGAVNAMHDSFTALGGLVPLVNMQLGEIVFGGVGSGLYGIVVFAVLTVFIAGLMVGRTPEYLGKKIERREVQFAILAVLAVAVFSLVPTALAVLLPAGRSAVGNNGAHGFSEILYAFTSATANNGSAFGGLSGNLFYNVLMGVVMLAGRFLVALPAIALAGSLAAKQSVPATAGTFSTSSPIFVVLLLGVIVIVGALTFVPADALGPLVEHLQAAQGKTF